jgi:glycosyltransferase involved in cell wall biosynthesis
MWPRILFVNHAAELGGAEWVLFDIVRNYAGSSTVLLLTDGPLRERLEQIGATVIVWSVATGWLKLSRRKSFSCIVHTRHVAKLVVRIGAFAKSFDMVYAHSQKAFTVCALARPIHKKPLLWHLHDILDFREYSRLAATLQVMLANRFADAVVVNSLATLEGFVKCGGKVELTHVHFPGIDPAPFDMVAPEDTVRLREELGLNNNLVIGCFSRLTPWKGQHLLIECMPGLPEHVHLLLGGAAFFDGHEYETMLRTRVTELGLGGRVSFTGFCKNVPLFMKSCDVIVHSSTRPEPFGRVVVEGMLARRPVVAADCGGPAEILEHNRTGFLYRTGDREALQSLLLRLIGTPEIGAAVINDAYERATSGFGIDAMLRQQEYLIRNQWETARGQGHPG